MAYDAFNTLVSGLEDANELSPEGVKKAILATGKVVGLSETFKMDVNGDCNRRYVLYVLEDGEFSPIRDY